MENGNLVMKQCYTGAMPGGITKRNIENSKHPRAWYVLLGGKLLAVYKTKKGAEDYCQHYTICNNLEHYTVSQPQ